MTIVTVITNVVYRNLIKEAYVNGTEEECRGYKTKELIANMSEINMNFPLVTCLERKLGYRFAIAEAIHIITGSNRVDDLKPYSAIIDKFSDDKVHFFGAYGPKIVDQIEYIGRTFKKDVFSRQAVINIWREKPAVSNDIPCTLSLQFLIRQDGFGTYRLNMIDTMRSSDIWLGVPYDWFSLSMVATYITLYLRKTIPELFKLQLGTFFMNAGSQHIYTDDKFYRLSNVEALTQSIRNDFYYERIDLDEFVDETDLLNHLKSLLNGEYRKLSANFLKELEEFYVSKD
jgi:thymidylate synthase